MTRDEEILPSIESDQMMYAFNDLVEEFKACRKFLHDLTANLSENEFYWSPQDSNQKCACIAQHLGHIALTEKEVGKKAEISFSFRLDLFDDLFRDTSSFIKQNELPTQDEIFNYIRDIHECFLVEIKYQKKADLLFALVNHNYKHIHDICNLLRLMDRPYLYSNVRPNSNRITCLENDVPFFKLPVYAN